MPLEVTRPAPYWLQCVAARVGELVATPLGMTRFREMLRAWRAKNGSVLLLSVEVRIPEERYAALAAIHDELCKSLVIDPWAGHDRMFDVVGDVGPDDQVDPDFFAGVAYTLLREGVAELGDEQRERVEAMLHDVEGDLGAGTAEPTRSPDFTKSKVEESSTSVLTEGELSMWNALDGKAMLAKELAKECNTTEGTVRLHVQSLRKKQRTVEHTQGRGYWRSDAPPADVS